MWLQRIVYVVFDTMSMTFAMFSKNLEYLDMIRKYFMLHNIKMEKQTQYKVDMQDEKINIVKID